MVTITTFGGSGKARMAIRVSLALSKGICTCMMTTSGERIPARPSRNMVWSSASSTFIGVLVSAFVFGSSPNTHPPRVVLPERHCTVYTIRSLDLRLFSSPLLYRKRHPHHGAPRKFERYSPECVEGRFLEVRPEGVHSVNILLRIKD